MNILFVTSNFPPREGGIAIFDNHICKELFNRGHKVIILAEHFQGSEEFDSRQEYPILRLSGKVRPTSVETICKIIYLSLKERMEMVFFGHFASTHWLGGVLATRFLKIPYAVLIHGTEFQGYYYHFTKADQWASKIVLKHASVIIVNSNATKNMIERHGYPVNQIHIIHPGTDPVNFIAEVQDSNLIEKLGLKGKRVLLTSSRLVAKKNHENVLKALPSVMGKVHNLVYLIVGKGEEEERLKKLTRDLNLGRHVKFVGYIEPNDMPLYFNICDAFIMPSKTVDFDYESFGIVYIEANACGKPVIGGRSGGVEDAVIDGVTGLLVDPENIDEISDAIIRLLTDENLARRLGENGRRRVEKELNWCKVGERIESVLRETISLAK